MALRRTSHLLMFSRRQFMLNATKGSSCTKAHQLPSSCNGPGWMSWQSSLPAAFQQVCRSRTITTYPSLAASIKVPSMGESIEEGTISAVLKQEGDSVEMDETIFQIETDKVTVDVRAPEAGVLTKIMVSHIVSQPAFPVHVVKLTSCLQFRSKKMKLYVWVRNWQMLGLDQVSHHSCSKLNDIVCLIETSHSHLLQCQDQASPNLMTSQKRLQQKLQSRTTSPSLRRNPYPRSPWGANPPPRTLPHAAHPNQKPHKNQAQNQNLTPSHPQQRTLHPSRAQTLVDLAYVSPAAVHQMASA